MVARALVSRPSWPRALGWGDSPAAVPALVVAASVWLGCTSVVAFFWSVKFCKLEVAAALLQAQYRCNGWLRVLLCLLYLLRACADQLMVKTAAVAAGQGACDAGRGAWWLEAGLRM